MKKGQSDYPVAPLVLHLLDSQAVVGDRTGKFVPVVWIGNVMKVRIPSVRTAHGQLPLHAAGVLVGGGVLVRVGVGPTAVGVGGGVLVRVGVGPLGVAVAQGSPC